MKKPLFREITLMNAFLCFCVVMIHLTSSPLSSLMQGSIPHLLVFLINKMLCFSVPSFIFLSGFKLYNKYGDSKVHLKTFFSRRIVKIVVPYLISVAVYFLYFFNKGWVIIKDLPEYFILGTLVAHFYYVVIAVQLYLLFPLIKYLFIRIPKTVTVVSFVLTAVLNQFISFNYSDRFFGTYIFYFVLGMVFARYKPLEKIKCAKPISYIGYSILAICHMSMSYFSSIGRIAYSYAGIVNLAYVLFAIGTIYALCMKISAKYDLLNRYANLISSVSYDVYLYHILVIFLLQYDVYPRFSFSVSDMFLISSVAVFVLIHIFAYVMSFIRCVKQKG